MSQNQTRLAARSRVLALPVLMLGLSACTINLTVPANTAPAPAAAPAPVASKPAASPTIAAPAAQAAGTATVLTANGWTEQFSARDSSLFMSAAYAAIPGDSSKALYAATAGAPKVADGALTLGNARFTVGALGTSITGATTPGGVFNIAGKDCALTLNVRSVAGTGNFFVYVDNNTTTQDASPHGKASRVVNVAATSLVEGQNVLKWSLPKSAAVTGSFLQLRADSAATVVIDSAGMSCS